MLNNDKRESKYRLDGEESDEEEKGGGGFCGGWCGLKFLFSKIGGIVADDPVEALTASSLRKKLRNFASKVYRREYKEAEYRGIR